MTSRLLIGCMLFGVPLATRDTISPTHHFRVLIKYVSISVDKVWMSLPLVFGLDLIHSLFCLCIEAKFATHLCVCSNESVFSNT